MVGRDQQGQTVVEMALVLMLLFIIVFGLVDLSYAIAVQSKIDFAVREGARVGAVQPAGTPLDGAVVVEAIRSRLPKLEQDKLNIDLSGSSETEVVVSADYLLQPLFALVFKEPFRLKCSLVMRRE